MASEKALPRKRLTKAEEQVMHILWEQEQAFVKEILAALPDPKPAYSTVSTVVRVLEEKGFVGHEKFGNTNRYFPKVAKEAYSSFWFNRFLNDYFGGSFSRLASFFARQNEMDIQDLEQLMQEINENLDDEKKKREKP